MNKGSAVCLNEEKEKEGQGEKNRFLYEILSQYTFNRQKANRLAEFNLYVEYIMRNPGLEET